MFCWPSCYIYVVHLCWSIYSCMYTAECAWRFTNSRWFSIIKQSRWLACPIKQSKWITCSFFKPQSRWGRIWYVGRDCPSRGSSWSHSLWTSRYSSTHNKESNVQEFANSCGCILIFYSFCILIELPFPSLFFVLIQIYALLGWVYHMGNLFMILLEVEIVIG